MGWTISKSFTVSYAHRVFNQDLYDTGLTPKCRNLHGHDSEIIYEITADDLRNDMVLDYTLFKHSVFADYSILHADDLDHTTLLSTQDPEFEKLLNALLPEKEIDAANVQVTMLRDMLKEGLFSAVKLDSSAIILLNFVPTAETLSRYLCDQFEKFLQSVPFETKHITSIAVAFNETKGSVCKYETPFFRDERF